jgi:aminopeptidase N/puromycin-sensitive aminopeptidase
MINQKEPFMKYTCLFIAGVLGLYVSLAAQRLPQAGVTPENYRLQFTPDLVKATFAGDETIRVRVNQPTTSVVLNSGEIEFQRVAVTAGGKTQTAKVTLDDKKEQVDFVLPEAIPAGTAEIHINYTGILNNQMRGFYLSQTKRRRYAVTQFEATDARRAFPSFDQPAFKATYDITLVIDKDDTAISNGSIVSDNAGPGDGKHTLVFSTTPKMSTYLVAMMVGDFQCVSGGADNIPIRVCSVPENKPYLGFAETAAENILKFYDQYYAIKYPFKKLDIIAFPDFSAGAMENTAAITYREEDLLVNEKTASVDQRKLVVDVLAHEMAHQWFGDLVTMKWWNDIWLNEGFATWMSNKPTEAWKPEWNASMDEVQGTGDALNTDKVSSIRAIRADAETPAEIAALFDGIAYGKTGAVLRMIEAYVGPQLFRDGVNLYLSKHAYDNATAEDFWNAETTATHKPIDKIMSTFVNQPGAPLVTVKTRCASGHTEVTLSQRRYFADRDKLEAVSPERWQIPVCLKTPGSKTAKCEVLAEKEQTFQLDGCQSWVFANAGGRGYYQVSYDPETNQKIAKVAETSLTPEERISFLNDSWAMVAVGRESISDYLNIVEEMKADRTRAVVESMLGHLAQIHEFVVSAQNKPALEAWTRQLLQPMVRELGTAAQPGDTDERRQLRALVLRTLGNVGKDPSVIAAAQATTRAYMKDPASVDPTIVPNALAIAASNGDATLYDSFREHMKSARTPDEFYMYLRNLNRFSDPALAARTAQLFLTPEIKGQDGFQILGLIGNPDTQKVGWEFLKAHYAELQDKLGAELGGGLTSVAGSFCDPQLRDDSQKFFGDQNIPGAQRILANARERVNACIDLRNLQQSNLDTYLTTQR